MTSRRRVRPWPVVGAAVALAVLGWSVASSSNHGVHRAHQGDHAGPAITGTATGTPPRAVASSSRPKRAGGPPSGPGLLPHGSPLPSALGNRPVVGDAVKPVIRGLIDRQGPPPAKDLPAVHAYVVKVNWADLQPTPFGPIAADNAVDRALARVRQPDYAALGMALKLRVFAGIGAPEWAKSLGGAPVPYVDNQPGASVTGGTIGRFWTDAFGRAYADLQQKLAARYDLVPEIREITVSRCTTIFDEPFVRQFGDKNNVAAMKAAGYTTAADEQCIVQSLSAHQVWRHTTSDVDFSPFPLITDPGGTRDLAFPESVMSTCRAVLGVRCGLQNNSLSSSKLDDPTFEQLYHRMSALGPALVLQTASRSRIGDPGSVLAAAVDLGANAVELPAGYSGWSLDLLESMSRKLAANPTRG